MSGWYTDVPGDYNLYQTAYDAMNAIDKQLGGTGKLGYAKRRERVIRIVGKKKKSSWKKKEGAVTHPSLFCWYWALNRSNVYDAIWIVYLTRK